MGKKMEKTYPYPEEGEIRWVSTDWLHNHLKEVKDGNIMVIDTQPNVHDYIHTHIPGARYFNQWLLRIPRGKIPAAYPPANAVSQLFSRVGLKKDVPTVVYSGKGHFKGWGDGLGQTFLTYSLYRYGHNSVYILDGGLTKWEKEDKPLSQKYVELKRSDFEIEIRDEDVADHEEIKETKDNDDVILLDARPPHLYEGQGPWKKPGHISGAVNLPWKSLMQEGNPRLLKPEEKLKPILEKRDIGPDKTLICSCGTGREATNEYLLFKWYLEYPNVKIDEGAFTEWLSYPDTETVTGKNPY